MGIGELADLRLHRRDHPLVGMAKARHCRTAAGIKNAPAIPGDEIDPVSTDRDRQVGLAVTREHIA